MRWGILALKQFSVTNEIHTENGQKKSNIEVKNPPDSPPKKLHDVITVA